MYGGAGVNETYVVSVEMLSLDGNSWQTLPTPMYYGDYNFASVPLPVLVTISAPSTTTER